MSGPPDAPAPAARRLVVVASSTDPEAGYVGERFAQHGFEVTTVFRDRGQVGADLVDRADAVLLLGSEWSVAAPADETALEAECALVRAAGSAGVAVLGVCYGAQVLAHAHGGRVSVAQQPEIGLVEVDSSDVGLVPPGPWWAFHLDVIDAPPTAEVLAENARGLQAFAVPGGLGVQFHPEVLPETLDDWCGRFPGLLERAGVARDELVRSARGRAPEARTAAHRLVDAFLERAAR